MLHLIWLKLRLKRIDNNYSEQGLTLIETLMAIVVIAIVITASTPPILLAVATRIQNRRAEQAMQIAQQEVERVRLIVDQGNYLNSRLPPASSITDPDNINTVGAPTAPCTPPPDSYGSCTSTQAFTEDNFLVQVFRDPGVSQAGVAPDGSAQVVAFRMGVRVYSPAAELGSLGTRPASLQMTNALGEQTRFPLAVIYADLARGDVTGTLDSYRDFVD